MVTRRISKILEKSPKSILLLGPRQVGKSTLLKSLKPDLVINLASERELLQFSADPDRLESLLLPTTFKRVMIDEVQRLPSLLNTIQSILDEKKTIQFLLSGSSARKLRRGSANLLPGRVFSYELGPLVASELDYALDTPLALKFGTLPEAYLTKDNQFREKLLTSYASTYLREEIQAEALTRNIEGFSRFLFEAAKRSGQIIDYTKFAKHARISRVTCTRFFEILEDTLIGFRCDCLVPESGTGGIRHPKFFFFDVGVLNGLLDNFKASSDRIGYLFEHLVFNQLKASAASKDVSIEIGFFRTAAGFEVDFLVRLRGELWAIECKSGQVNSQDAQPLLALESYFPEVKRRIIVTPKEENRAIGNGKVQVMGLNRLLKQMDL